MSATIQIGELSILVTKKDIKNVHLSVHPPDGRVTLTAPSATRLDVARAYAISERVIGSRMLTACRCNGIERRAAPGACTAFQNLGGSGA